ncbi:protein lifeguard 1 [Neosynchiropus ocellatus]
MSGDSAVESFPSPDVTPPPYDNPPSPPPTYTEAAEPLPVAKGESDGLCMDPPPGEDQCLPDDKPDASEAPLDQTPSAFDDKTVRRAFIRKVFSILTLQLLFTFGMVCLFTYSTVVKKAIQSSIWIYLSSFFVFAAVAISLSCCKSLSRRYPWNILGLAVVTVSLSFMVGTVASYHDTVAVVITMAVTLAISLAIIVFSVQTRFDLSCCYGLGLILLVDLFMFGVFSSFYYDRMADIAYGCLGALLYAMFLAGDCAVIMTGDTDPEDYITAALKIYLDIVLIFLFLLGKR